ncbi:DUF503 domain-containing protein [Candidatus Atribacteria bacterium HGW-Atribacteria-1]|nr:MAG: DUF503 domain-containing protein [Candidatus Atribacteria bacterium HGW-Atribacteria-1]
MIIGSVTLKLYAPWVHSLKEKCMLVKSIMTKTKSKFNVSIAEVSEQDRHQTIILGIACVANTVSRSCGIIDNVIAFIESNTETEILDIQRETR